MTMPSISIIVTRHMTIATMYMGDSVCMNLTAYLQANVSCRLHQLFLFIVPQLSKLSYGHQHTLSAHMSWAYKGLNILPGAQEPFICMVMGWTSCWESPGHLCVASSCSNLHNLHVQAVDQQDRVSQITTWHQIELLSRFPCCMAGFVADALCAEVCNSQRRSLCWSNVTTRMSLTSVEVTSGVVFCITF